MRAPAHGKAEKVQVRVDDIVLSGCSAQGSFLHENHWRIPVDGTVFMKTKSPWTAHLKLGGGLGISACEQRDLMALTHQLLRQVGHDPFGSAVKLRGHTFPERRQLS